MHSAGEHASLWGDPVRIWRVKTLVGWERRDCRQGWSCKVGVDMRRATGTVLNLVTPIANATNLGGLHFLRVSPRGGGGGAAGPGPCMRPPPSPPPPPPPGFER